MSKRNGKERREESAFAKKPSKSKRRLKLILLPTSTVSNSIFSLTLS